MAEIFDVTAPKKSANLSINSDLLEKAKALNVNLSATLEKALQDKLAMHSAENWAIRNKNAIRTYNEFVEQNGYFGDEYREF